MGIQNNGPRFRVSKSNYLPPLDADNRLNATPSKSSLYHANNQSLISSFSQSRFSETSPHNSNNQNNVTEFNKNAANNDDSLNEDPRKSSAQVNSHSGANLSSNADNIPNELRSPNASQRQISASPAPNEVRKSISAYDNNILMKQQQQQISLKNLLKQGV